MKAEGHRLCADCGCKINEESLCPECEEKIRAVQMPWPGESGQVSTGQVKAAAKRLDRTAKVLGIILHK